MIRSPVRSAVRAAIGRMVAPRVGSERITATNFATLTAAELQSQFGWTRSGSATMIDASGAVVYGAHNLLFPSVHGNHWAVWNGGSVSGAGAAIDGAATSRATCTITYGGVYRVMSMAVAAGQEFTVAAYVSRAGGSGKVQFGSDSAGLSLAVFDFDAGAFESGPVNKSATAVPGGWLLRVKYAPPAALTSVATVVYMTAGTAVDFAAWLHLGWGNLPYVPTTSSAIHLTRAQHYQTAGVPGPLLEGPRTQLLPRVESFDDAAWAKNNATVTANAAAAPDSSVTADRISATAANGEVVTSLSITGGVAYTFSVWLRSESGTVSCRIQGVSTGTVVSATTTWTRFVVTETWGATATRFPLIRVLSSGESVLAWGAQLEAGSHASSYIPNAGTGTVLRAADSADIGPGANFDAIFPPAVGGVRQGTLVVEWCDVGSDARDLFMLHANGSASQLLSFYKNGGGGVTGVSRAGSTTQVDASLGTLVANGRNKVAISWGPGGVFFSLNGNAPAGNASATVPAPTHARFAGSGLWHGEPPFWAPIRRTTYATQRTGAALQALSAL